MGQTHKEFVPRKGRQDSHACNDLVGLLSIITFIWLAIAAFFVNVAKKKTQL